jgi:hypothetical protein
MADKAIGCVFLSIRRIGVKACRYPDEVAKIVMFSASLRVQKNIRILVYVAESGYIQKTVVFL